MKTNSTKILAFITISLCFSVALCGAYVQSISNSSVALSRSGAIIVCIGILYAFIEIKLIFKSFEEKRLENDIVFSDKQIQDGIRGSTNQLKIKAESDRRSPDNNAAIIDAAILIAGTLLWGFGDLII